MASSASTDRSRRDTTRREHGLFTPEPTPGPELGRVDADKKRQVQESARLPSIAEDGSQGSALSTQSKPEADVESIPSTEAEDDQGKQSAPAPAQIEAVEMVLACPPNQYRKILGLGSRNPDAQADKEEVVNTSGSKAA